MAKPAVSTNHDVVFLAGARTGFGAFGGALRDLTATDLGAHAARAALDRAGVSPAHVHHVLMGNTLQTSADAPYLARHVALRAGCPITTPAVTVNRLCGSGFESIIQGARMILLGEADLVLAGGAESMSQAPHVLRGARWGLRLGGSPPLEDLLWSALTDNHCKLPMAETAENLATDYSLPRAEVDQVALRSQAEADRAWREGVYAEEVVAVPGKDRKGREIQFAADEHRRPDTTAEVLAGLPPYFRKDGIVTAGNASGIVDGAAAVVLTSGAAARERGLAPIGRITAWAVAGVEPTRMGVGPVPAARQALAGAGLKLQEMDLVEINEAFAAQYLAVERELGLDRDRTNVDGGAIAIGHPLGASGTRITLHLLLALRRRGLRFGLGAACIGGGQGVAVIVEAFPAT